MKTKILSPHLSQLSVFFPCYNEEANIAKTVAAALPIIKKTADKWELILVNDGSKDKTLEILNQIKKQYGESIVIVNHPQNRGYGAALKSGLYTAKYPWITFADSDGQFDFNDLAALIQRQQATNADLVIGYYLHRQVPFYRKIGSTVWQLAIFMLFGLKVRDIDCAFKLVSKKVIDTIPQLQSERGPFISSELLIQAKNSGFKITEVGVHHYPRLAGEATGTKLNVVIAGLTDLLKLKRRLL